MLHRILPPQNFNNTILFIGHDFILIQYLHKRWFRLCIKCITIKIISWKGQSLAFQKNQEINNLSKIKHIWNYWIARDYHFFWWTVGQKVALLTVLLLYRSLSYFGFIYVLFVAFIFLSYLFMHIYLTVMKSSDLKLNSTSAEATSI